VCSVPLLAALGDGGFKGKGEGRGAITDVPASRAARCTVFQVLSGLKWDMCDIFAFSPEKPLRSGASVLWVHTTAWARLLHT
jgi:hypothetical protein